MELYAFRILSLETKPPPAIANLQWYVSLAVMFPSIDHLLQ